MNKLTINDLPPEVVNRMRDMISSDEKIINMRNKKLDLLRCRDYIGAQKISSMINAIESRVINQYLADYEGQSERMNNLMGDMSEADREEINILTNSIIFLCDTIETWSMDFNAILQKYHPDYKIEMYNKIIQLGKEAKEQVEFMSKNTDMVYQVAFADSGDEITIHILNKVKSFIKKLRRKE